jgi:hypothetical protein
MAKKREKMLSEDIITSLREKNIQEPICWLVCFEDRALQAVPPKSEGPHLMVFSTNSKADRFIKGRKKYYHEEPLSVVVIDAIENLHELALATSKDPNYEAPPCGLVIDFDYESASSKQTLSPKRVAKMKPQKIQESLGLKTETVKKDPEPISTEPGQATEAKKSNWKVFGVGCLIVGLTTLFCVSLGVVLWFTGDQIPMLANLFETNTPLPTASPTISPTAPPTSTPEPHILVYPPTGDEEVLKDSFDNNKNQWISYYAGRVASVTDGHLRVVSYERGYVNVATCNGCGNYSDNFYFQADLALNEFTPVSYGLAFCITDNNNYYIFTINHNTFKYALIKLVDDEWITLIEDTISEEINNHPKINTLSVSFEEGYMELFINGVMVDTYKDTKPLKNGEIGFIIDNAGAELFGDNVFAYRR